MEEIIREDQINKEFLYLIYNLKIKKYRRPQLYYYSGIHKTTCLELHVFIIPMEKKIIGNEAYIKEDNSPLYRDTVRFTPGQLKNGGQGCKIFKTKIKINGII